MSEVLRAFVWQTANKERCACNREMVAKKVQSSFNSSHHLLLAREKNWDLLGET